MKLGVSYNVFDGEELLEGSIKCIRSEVDYISVVYQEISNFGNKCNENLVKLLMKLYSDGLIDLLYKYEPILNINSAINELNKRNIGLQLSRENDCSHHISMDTDEYYILDEFKYLKNVMNNGNYDSSYSQMQTYYKTTEYVLDPPEEYYVPLIYKIRDNIKYVYGYQSPVLVDPTRRMDYGNSKIFNRDEIQMHHLSMIRNDISSKFNNSSAKCNFNDSIVELINYYENWNYGDKVLLPGKPPYYNNVKKIKKLF